MATPEEIEVLGGGPVAALATSRLARARLAVRWLADPADTTDGGEGDVLPAELYARLPAADDAGADRRIVLHRWMLFDGSRWTGTEFRESGPEGLPVAVLRSELTERCAREARELGVSPRKPEAAPPSPDPPGAPPTPAPAARVGRSLGRLLTEPSFGEPSRRRPTTRTEWHGCLRFNLEPARIEARFGLRPGEGATVDWLAAPDGGIVAGGSLRTYRDCLGLTLQVWGVVRPPTAADLDQQRRRFLAHPALAPLLAGSRLSSEVRRELRPPPADRWGGSGYLRLGRGAGLEASNGMELRGLPAELASAEIAAEVTATALRSGPRLGDRSGEYARRLRADPSYVGLADWAARGRRLRRTAGASAEWPRFQAELFHRLMTEEGGPKRSVRSTVMSTRRDAQLSPARLFRSAWNWWEAW
ncbi:MAG: hypothetical protein L3K11_05860 [Thermoplasmata archaeon]|nr:hypothetical protein [Thermoplasmata archaeon]